MAYRDEVLTDSPIIYLELEETSGSPTNSGSGSPTYTVGSGVTKNATGKWGNAWGINASTNGYVWINGAGTFLGDVTFSVEMWVKTTDSGKVIAYFNQPGTGLKYQLNVNSSGKAEFSIWVSTVRTLTSTTTINDNNWHHIVFVGAGTASRFLYVDGVEEATNTGTISTSTPSSGRLDLGMNNTSSATATIDEFAVYDSALSAARVAAHYNATDEPVEADVEVNVDTVTGSAQSYEPTVTARGTILTASSDSHTFSGGGTETTPTTMFVGWNPGGGSLAGEGTSTFTFNFTSLPATATWHSVKVRVYVVAVDGTPNIRLSHSTYGVIDTFVLDDSDEATWLEFTLPNSRPANGSTFTLSRPAGSNGSGNPYFATFATSESSNDPEFEYVATPLVNVTVDVSTVTATAGAVEPTIEAQKFVTVDVTNATASAQSHDVTWLANAPIDAETATASVVAPEVMVETEVSPNVILDFATVMASSQAYEAVFVTNALYEADTPTSLAAPYEVSTEVTQGALVDVIAPELIATAYKPSDVNGIPIEESDLDDPYFVSTRNLDPTTWFRFKERAGRVLMSYGHSPIAPLPEGALYPRYGVDTETQFAYDNFGATMGLNEGPEGRPSLYFGGDDFMKQREWHQTSSAGFDEGSGGQSALEFTIRTSKRTQFIMGGVDQISSGRATVDWCLLDGRLTQMVGNQPIVQGFKDIADGKWHHILVRSTTADLGPFTLPGTVLELWVDGEMEIRRSGSVYHSQFGYQPRFQFATPDFIGGRPQIPREYGNPTPTNEWFVGDLSELVYYRGSAIGPDNITLQRDNMMAVGAVRLESAKAEATINAPTIDSNKPRALLLDFHPSTLVVSWSPWDMFDVREYRAGDTRVMTGGLIDSFDLHGANYGTDEFHPDYQVFVASAYGYMGSKVKDDSGNLQSLGFMYWTHPITAEQRLIDLENDLNLDDFDVIIPHQFPNFSDNIQRIKSMGGNDSQYLKILQDIKNFVANGGGLYVTDPNFAVEFGLIDDVEWVPNLMNSGSNGTQGEASGRYDYTSWERNPWEYKPAIDWLFVDEELLLQRTGSHTFRSNFKPVRGEKRTDFAPSDSLQGPYHYRDTHANQKQRVINLVPGLTDRIDAFLEDYLNWREFGTFTDTMVARKYAERPNGLLLGDEFYIPGTAGSGHRDPIASFEAYRGDQKRYQYYTTPYSPTNVNIVTERSDRRFGVYAPPMSAVKQGTVVTRMCDTFMDPADGYSDRTYGSPAYATTVPDIEVENPYRDYACAIVVQPGQTLDGVQVTGKVYCNFVEVPFLSMFPYIATYQLIPSNEKMLEDELPEQYLETEETREWQFSMWRGNFSGGFQTVDAGVRVSYTQGNKRISRDSAAEQLTIAQWRGNWPVVGEYMHSMNSAAWAWMFDKDTVEGRAIAGVETARATGQTVEPVIHTVADVVVDVTTLQAVADVNLAEGMVDPDVTVFVFAATATARVGAFLERVDVASAMALAAVYEEEGGSLATSDNLVLAMRGSVDNITVNMREDI